MKGPPDKSLVSISIFALVLTLTFAPVVTLNSTMCYGGLAERYATVVAGYLAMKQGLKACLPEQGKSAAEQKPVLENASA